MEIPKAQLQNLKRFLQNTLFYCPLFCKNLLGFTWKDNRITKKVYKLTWKECLDLKGISGTLWILRNTKIPIPVHRSTYNVNDIFVIIWSAFCSVNLIWIAYFSSSSFYSELLLLFSNKFRLLVFSWSELV